ncbi:TFIIH/NER complex subunit [Pleurotus pulmonarius]|nr:TFIIH/NER complex subunit [Pleurotus pulmonarius]KAF4608916.1 TFIIH/NER complex subunit [Pleurotus pulmonarius]
MSSNARSNVAGTWLQGKTIRKGSNLSASSALRSASHTRSTTPSVIGSSSTSSAPTSIFLGGGAGGGVKDPSGRVSEFSSADDQCPVCKSDRYLNNKLRLLVSTCYHKMCESCIDRLFTLGPAPCPAPGCTRVLRKLAFMPQTFEDLGVEKEVAIRRRIAKEFNKRREDFPNLRSFNDYLEEVEDITFNLINEIDLPKTEARILQYRAENAALIELNIQREEAYAQSLKDQEEAERKEREQRAAELRRQEEEEREEKEKDKRELIDKLESSQTDARKVVARSRAEAQKRSSARAASGNKGMISAAETTRALRTRAAQNAVPDPPHVPLQDDYYAYEDVFAMRPGGYDDVMSEAVRRDREGIMRGGGYRVEEAWERALRSSVAGLDLMPRGGDVIMSSTA